MLSHNVNPESGEHLPQYQQVYDTALRAGAKVNNGVRVPVLPRKVHDDIRLTPTQLEEINQRNQTMPKDRTKGQQRKEEIERTITLVKPNLEKEQYFNSKHTTPNQSVTDLEN